MEHNKIFNDKGTTSFYEISRASDYLRMISLIFTAANLFWPLLPIPEKSGVKLDVAAQIKYRFEFIETRLEISEHKLNAMKLRLETVLIYIAVYICRSHGVYNFLLLEDIKRSA